MLQQPATNHFRIKRSLAERDGPGLINLPLPLSSVPTIALMIDSDSSSSPNPSASQTGDKREPALIDLPVPLPSIPIVAPLIGDSSTSQSASQPAVSPSPTPSGGGHGHGNGNGNGNGNGKGGTSGGNSSGGTVSDSSGGSNPSGNTTDKSNTGGGSGSEGSSGGSGGDTSHKGSGDDGISRSIPPSTSTMMSVTSSVGSVPTDLGVINAVSDPNAIENNNNAVLATESLSLIRSSSRSATGLASTQTSTGVNGSDPQNGDTNAGGPSATGNGVGGQANVSKHGLSSGGIAAIVVVLFILLIGLVVVILRRRNIARRSKRRNKWFGGFVGYGSTRSVRSTFGTNSAAGRTGAATVGSGTASARSSFATNFDHGLRFIPDLSAPFDINALLPQLPPMAEINQIGPLINTSNNNTKMSRYSTGSDGSHTSQYLMVPGLLDQNTPPEATPMSVRPFSPSESFAFPKPPSGEWERSAANGLATSNENDWLTHSTPISPSIDSGRTLTPKQFHAMNTMKNIHPIADSTNVSIGSVQNPFTNPSSIATQSTNHRTEFMAVEVIRRPFAPTLSDELAVEPGESVHVGKLFDDGWAYVEKIGTDAKGLIPIDCMRDSGQDLPAFLATKRVSSYYPVSEEQMGPVMGDAV